MTQISLYDRPQRLLQYLVPIVVVLLRRLLSPNFAPNTVQFHEMMTGSMQRGTVERKNVKECERMRQFLLHISS